MTQTLVARCHTCAKENPFTLQELKTRWWYGHFHCYFACVECGRELVVNDLLTRAELFEFKKKT